jgi:DNA-binding protein Fis
MAAADISGMDTSSDVASSASSRLDALTAVRGHSVDPGRRAPEPVNAQAGGGRDDLTGIFDGLVVDDTSNVGLITVDELERRYIERVLALTAGNKSRAAQILGFDRRTLYRKIERYGRSA